MADLSQHNGKQKGTHLSSSQGGCSEGDHAFQLCAYAQHSVLRPFNLLILALRPGQLILFGCSFAYFVVQSYLTAFKCSLALLESVLSWLDVILSRLNCILSCFHGLRRTVVLITHAIITAYPRGC